MEQQELFAAYGETPPKSTRARVKLDEIQGVFSTAPGWLVEDMRKDGQTVEIHLADKGDDGYVVIDGRRRIAALRQLRKETAEARIYDYEDVKDRIFAMSVRLNTLRADNKKSNYVAIMEMAHRGLDAQDISKATGLTVPKVKAELKIAAVHPALVRSWLEEERISDSAIDLLAQKVSRKSQEMLLGRDEITLRDIREICPEFSPGPVQEVIPEVWIDGAIEAVGLLERTIPKDIPADTAAFVVGLGNKLKALREARQ